ncbi:aminoglycoside phosphotransferase family protein, partial [Frigoribacterium faeni]|uniref:phosphotransferase family protein n=1 Tax=Frigoribacterium faeni TaxID=145483 RepID=UPI001FAD4295
MYKRQPRRAAEIDAVYAEIDRRRASWVGDPLTVIHGDLHLEQLFVDPAEPWRVTGVLDIDTAGVGHPARDAAALVAHLVVTGQWHRGNGDDPEARACERLADEVARVWSCLLYTTAAADDGCWASNAEQSRCHREW